MNFGEFFKKKRLENELTLRKFCLENDYDPGNISKIERGLLPPPQSEEKLTEYARALSIKKGSDEYIQFLDLAAAENRVFQPKNISKEELLKKLPILFRTLDNKKLTAEKLDRIIQFIENAHRS